jgi:hypothetical protein
MSEELTLRRSERVGGPVENLLSRFNEVNEIQDNDVEMRDDEIQDNDVEMRDDESSDDEAEAETVIDDESSDDEEHEHILGKGGKNKKNKHSKHKSNNKTTNKAIKNMKHGGKNKTRKTAPLFKLKSGDLTKYGYHLKGTSRSRHIALGKARKHYPYATMIRKLNALAVLHKNKNASYTKKAKADMNYLRRTRKAHFSKSAGKR